jgi:hypothetical protein
VQVEQHSLWHSRYMCALPRALAIRTGLRGSKEETGRSAIALGILDLCVPEFWLALQYRTQEHKKNPSVLGSGPLAELQANRESRQSSEEDQTEEIHQEIRYMRSKHEQAKHPGTSPRAV